MTIGIHVTSPVPRGAWAEVLAADPGATVLQSPAWFGAMLRVSKGMDASRLYVLADGRRLVLPLMRRRPLPGVVLDEGYPPQMGAGGLVATGGLRSDDVRIVLTDLLASRAVMTRIKTNHDRTDRWQAGLVPGVSTVCRRVEVLDLDGGFARIWQTGFTSSARRAVRKAEKSGLVVERDTSGRLASEFYDLYLAWIRRRARESGLPAAVSVRRARAREPMARVEAVARSLGEACRIWLARLDGEPVASLISVVGGDHANAWRGYSRKELAGPTRANTLLDRLAIEDACEAGCRYYNLGESGGVATLEHYKQSMGARPRMAVECRIERLPLARAEQIRDRAESAAMQAAIAVAAALRPLAGGHRAGAGGG